VASLDASGSTGSAPIVSYAWDFGDGHTTTTQAATTTHAWSTAGPYTITVTVTDNTTATASTHVDLQVVDPPPPPDATFTPSTHTPEPGQVVTFTGTDAGPYARYHWHFTDGPDAVTTAPTVDHTYTTAGGGYGVTLTVDDGYHRASNPSFTLAPTLTVVARVAALKAASGRPGVAVALDASGSSSPSGVLRYDWSFGDGTVAHTTTPKTNHTWAKAGTYTVQVTITDGIGLHAHASTQVKVVAPVSCVVPRLKNHTLGGALRALQAAHCTLGKVTRRHSRSIRKGRVISASKSVGARVPRNTAISIVISRGP
jgi:hypothetical protein